MTVEDAMMAGKTPLFRGIVQRCDWVHHAPGVTPPGGKHLGFMVKMTFAKITDGSSKTMLAGDKWVHNSLYTGIGGQADDRGWSDGWDFDALRSTLIRPRSDGEDPAPDESASDAPADPLNYPFGSAHPGGINVMFADGSTRGISYDVDLETFNQLGNRSDGETIQQDF